MAKDLMIFEYLLESKDNRAECLDIENYPFEIGVYKHEDYGFLIATAYRDGKIVEGHDGLILSKDVILDWLNSSKAQITEY